MKWISLVGTHIYVLYELQSNYLFRPRNTAQKCTLWSNLPGLYSPRVGKWILNNMRNAQNRDIITCFTGIYEYSKSSHQFITRILYLKMSLTLKLRFRPILLSLEKMWEFWVWGKFPWPVQLCPPMIGWFLEQCCQHLRQRW